MSSARIFSCTRCHRQVVICSCCDRGNIYCGPCCSQEAREESLHEAGKRYQNTFAGKINHAERQRRYRERAKKVTHHSSIEPGNNDLLQSQDHELENLSQNGDIYCHFCGCKCESSLRVDFLKTHVSGLWPLGP